MGKSRFKHTSLIGNFHYWHSSVFESHKVALKFSSKEKKSPMVWKIKEYYSFGCAAGKTHLESLGV